MKIQRKKSFFTRTRTLIIAAVLVLAVAGAVFWWFFLRNNNAQTVAPTNTISYDPPTQEQIDDSVAAKQRAVEEEDNGNNTTPPTSDSLIVTISRAGQVAAQISVRTVIEGANSGTCDMMFTKSGATTVTKSFDITQEATSHSCNGDINTSDFGVSGEWNLSVTAKASGVSSHPATQKVMVQK